MIVSPTRPATAIIAAAPASGRMAPLRATTTTNTSCAATSSAARHSPPARRPRPASTSGATSSRPSSARPPMIAPAAVGRAAHRGPHQRRVDGHRDDGVDAQPAAQLGDGQDGQADRHAEHVVRLGHAQVEADGRGEAQRGDRAARREPAGARRSGEGDGQRGGTGPGRPPDVIDAVAQLGGDQPSDDAARRRRRRRPGRRRQGARRSAARSAPAPPVDEGADEAAHLVAHRPVRPQRAADGVGDVVGRVVLGPLGGRHVRRQQTDPVAERHVLRREQPGPPRRRTQCRAAPLRLRIEACAPAPSARRSWSGSARPSAGARG